MTADPFPVELVPLAALQPHPANYQAHPEDQLAHLATSIQEHGLYRPIVIAQDATILAGHGVVQACTRIGLDPVPAYRVPYAPDDPRALRILAGDNAIPLLADRDDRHFADLLKLLQDTGTADGPDPLAGTGFDAAMLANLVFVTRPASELPDQAAADEWAGMPAYAPGTTTWKVVVNLRTAEDRAAFLRHIQAETLYGKDSRTTSCWWPDRPYEDLAALQFEG